MEKSNKTRLGNGVDQPRHQRSNSREFQKERIGGCGRVYASGPPWTMPLSTHAPWRASRANCGLDRVTCFVQWDSSKHDASRSQISTFTSGRPFQITSSKKPASVPGLDSWKVRGPVERGFRGSKTVLDILAPPAEVPGECGHPSDLFESIWCRRTARLSPDNPQSQEE